MKHINRVALALLLAMTAITVSAQVHESKSYIRKTRITREKKVSTPTVWKKCQWYGRVGVLIPTSVSEEASELLSPKPGFDLDFGFKLRMGRYGWYWGMDLALFTDGIKIHEDYSSHNVMHEKNLTGCSSTKIGGRLGLSTFGWRVKFSDFILDLNAGLTLSYASKFNLEDWDGMIESFDDYRFGFNIPVGLGLAYKKVTLDMTLFINPLENYEVGARYYKPFTGNYGHDWFDVSYNTFRISVGYLF